MQVQALFFDAAGTLFRLAEPVGQTYARLAALHGLHADPARLDAAFRTSWKALPPPLHPANHPPLDDDISWWRQLVSMTFGEALGHSLPPSTLSPLFDDLYAHYAQSNAWTLYPDVLPALKRFASRRQLLVVSNFDRRLRTILRGLGIADFFSHTILSSEVGASKPHPRIFAAALQAAGLPSNACLHIGDDPICDHQGAQAAGLHSFALKRPEHTLADVIHLLASMA